MVFCCFLSYYSSADNNNSNTNSNDNNNNHHHYLKVVCLSKFLSDQPQTLFDYYILGALHNNANLEAFVLFKGNSLHVP